MAPMSSAASGADRDRGTQAAVRLAEFFRVATSDVDQAAEQVGRIFCPHDLRPLCKTAEGFYATHNCAAFDGFSINYVAYGGSVSINPGCLERFFLVQLPLSGSTRIRTGSREFATDPDATASLLSPTLPTRMVWEDCAQLILLLDRRVVEQRAAAFSGKSVRPVEFNPAIDLTTPSARALQASMHGLVDLAEGLGAGHRVSAVAAADWREGLLDLLLTRQQHDLSEAIRTFSGQAETLPRTLMRARDCLQAYATEPLDLERLAQAAGIGIRALQLGFQRHFGTSISDMLLDIRLAELNAKLMAASPDARIIDIAFDLGFTHLGRMAGAYRQKFGEAPSATLRRLH
jgi:AraC-like DNA-binding protein